jgi:DNA-binding transcriptional LysR family regulator
MTFDQIVYFLEAAKQEHIGRAAKTLSVSISTVSHAISKIEDELGNQLFDRIGKTVVLNSFGRAFSEQSERVVREFYSLQKTFSQSTLQLRQHVRVAVNHDFAPRVGAVWGGISRKHPTYSCEVFSLRSSQVVQDVLNGQVDVGFCLSPVPHPKIEAVSIFEDDLCLVVSAAHPQRKELSGNQFKLLNEYAAALPKAFTGVEVCENHPVLAQHGLVPRETFLFDRYEVGFQHIQHGTAWGLVPRFLLEQDAWAKNLLKIPTPKTWKAQYTFSCVRLRDRRPLDAEIQVLQELQNIFCKEFKSSNKKK